MSEARKAIITFLYTEKIKSSLIIASSLIEHVKGLNDAERAGAEKILYAYFDALTLEVNMAANAAQLDGFRIITSKIRELVEHVKKRNYEGAVRLVSEAISAATTQGNQSAQMLNEMGLL